MRAAGPDLAAVHEPAAVDLLAGRSQGGEVRARIRFAHADAEVALAAGDARQDALTLLLCAEAEQERAALAVRDPVQRHRLLRAVIHPDRRGAAGRAEIGRAHV